MHTRRSTMLAKSAATACSFAEAPQININNSANGFAGRGLSKTTTKIYWYAKVYELLASASWFRPPSWTWPAAYRGGGVQDLFGMRVLQSASDWKGNRERSSKGWRKKSFCAPLCQHTYVFSSRKLCVCMQANNKRKLLLSKSFSHTNFLVTFFPQR